MVIHAWIGRTHGIDSVTECHVVVIQEGVAGQVELIELVLEGMYNQFDKDPKAKWSQS